ncbi:MAG: hypothetical protein L0Z62_42240 [Gemmataceae bacterium]|nr:hypothetical protein [Gemmataceae bacterium]
MSEATTLPGLPRQAPSQPLTCRLRPKHVIGRQGPVPHMAEVELQNISATPFEIAYRMTVLQYLNLVVTGADGSLVSEGHFGDRFAPTLAPLVLRLEPGEKFTADVHLLATVRCDPIPPGTYTVQAIYEYDGFRAVSDPLQVEIPNPA